jgi:hypothetical protein
MDERLANCPDRTCTCLTSFAGRVCFGRLPSPLPDGDLFNTHRRCETEGGGDDHGDADTQEFNLADAYYEVVGYIMAIRQVLDLHLYNPGPDLDITDPVGRLVGKLTGKPASAPGS